MAQRFKPWPSPVRTALRWLKPIIILLLPGSACSEFSPTTTAWQDLIETLGDTTAAVVGVGAFEEGIQGPALGSVQSGTIAPGGEWFAVSDRDPPHIRVFRADGTMHTSFLMRGEGPAESQAPLHLILADSDTTLLLLEYGQLRRFTLNGTELARFPLGALGYRPQTMGRGCEDAPFLLAPRMDPLSPDGPVSWIHRIELDASGSLRLIPVWEDGFSYSRGGFLSSHRLLVVGDLLLISRSTAQGRREETLYCRGDGALGPPEDVPSSATTPVPVGTGIEGVSDPMTWPLEPGKEYPMVVGAHPLGDRGILRVGQIYYVGESDTYPEIDVSLSVQIGADTVASARFPLFYEVLDLVGTRALVTHTDLIPRVFLFELNFPSE